MINSVIVTNHLGESITLELRSPEKSGFLVKDVDGLGPTKARINTTEMSTYDGAIYNSARKMSRNVVFRLAFLPLPDIETVRRLSYKYFPTKQEVTLEFITDNRECKTTGYVESNEVDIFSAEEGSIISIVCPDAYLYATELTELVLSGVTPSFEFPFSNESLVTPLLEFGELILQTAGNIPYDGDADIGFTIYIHAIGTAEDLIIYNTLSGETMTIDTDVLTTMTGDPIISGDNIVISTVTGNKHITLTRDGEDINILNCLGANSQWIRLYKGDNVFGFAADVGEDNLQFRVENSVRYEGV